MRSQCRVAPSLGALEDTPENVWGTTPYANTKEPCVFFGMYDLRDYLALWRHRGKAWVLWAGSDIKNLQSGFIFNDGKLKKLSVFFGDMFRSFIFNILSKAEHWVENIVEHEALEHMGISSEVCPSFLGDINLPITYKPSERMSVYISCSGERQLEYGFDTIERIAPLVPYIDFHLYGGAWKTEYSNVISHGRVPKEQMNREISEMQCGLRLNEFDGFSEITAKAVLQGQYAITRIPYPLIEHFRDDTTLVRMLNIISELKQPNFKARNYYQKILNNYPWVSKTPSHKDI